MALLCIYCRRCSDIHSARQARLQRLCLGRLLQREDSGGASSWRRADAEPQLASKLPAADVVPRGGWRAQASLGRLTLHRYGKNCNPCSSRKISFHARQSLSCAYRGKFSSVFTVSKPLQKVKTKGVGCLHSAERLVCRAVSCPLPWRAGWR